MSEIPPPTVRLRAVVADRELEWEGEIVRTEGALDPATRNVVAVARVEDPYGLHAESAPHTPLAPGLFVRAEILGRQVDEVFALPSSAYRPGVGLLVVDDDDRLRIRDVEVLRRDARRVFVTKGIAAGERVVVSAVESPIDGMEMRVDEQDAAPEVESEGL
jgi:multidrug efflux pump subunit AcrA (membrane-fusion protein)